RFAKLVAEDHQAPDRRLRDHCSRPGTAVDHRDLAEELALAPMRDGPLLADDLGPSLHDDEHGLASAPLPDDERAGVVAVLGHPPKDLAKLPAGEPREDRDLREDVDRGFGHGKETLPVRGTDPKLANLDRARSHRLVAQDTTLSRWRHGFEPRWDYGDEQGERRQGAREPSVWAPIGHRMRSKIMDLKTTWIKTGPVKG